MTGVLVKKEFWTQRQAGIQGRNYKCAQREDGHMTGVPHVQAKKLQKLQTSHLKPRRGKKGSFSFLFQSSAQLTT